MEASVLGAEHTYTHLHTYTHIHTHTLAHTHTQRPKRRQRWRHPCWEQSTHTHIHTRARTHTHTHTHIHTHRPKRRHRWRPLCWEQSTHGPTRPCTTPMTNGPGVPFQGPYLLGETTRAVLHGICNSGTKLSSTRQLSRPCVAYVTPGLNHHPQDNYLDPAWHT